MRNNLYFVGSQRVSEEKLRWVAKHHWNQDGISAMAWPGRKGIHAVPLHGSDLVRVVAYNPNGSKHACDARCRTAKGHNCECSCGGVNHGIGQ